MYLTIDLMYLAWLMIVIRTGHCGSSHFFLKESLLKRVCWFPILKKAGEVVLIFD